MEKMLSLDGSSKWAMNGSTLGNIGMLEVEVGMRKISRSYGDRIFPTSDKFQVVSYLINIIKISLSSPELAYTYER